MHTSPRHHARCNRDEARARIVALMTCCFVRLSNGGWALLVRLSHCKRARSEVFVVVPVWRAAWIRWLSVLKSEACFSLCLTEQPSQIQNQSDFRATQKTGPTDKPLPSRPQEIIISARISFSARAAIVPLLDKLHARVAHATLRTLDSSFFAVAHQQWLLCSQNATL